ASRAWINGTAAWADQVNKVVASLTQRFARPPELEALATRIPGESEAVKAAMRGLGETLGSLEFTERQNGQLTCRFRLGGVGDAIADAAGEAGVQVTALGRSVARVHEMLGQVVDGDLAWPRAVEADDWLPAVGQLEGRGTAVEALLDDYAGARSGADDGVRSARWVNRTDQDTELISAPIEPGRLLEDCLWSRCFAAVTTSATLTAVGRFDRFLERSGIGDIEGMRIPSPFDFPNIAVLCVPSMRTDPPAREAHTAEIAALLPALLAREQSALVLFTSWRQLNDVKAALPARLADALQIQGEQSKQRMLERHRTRIDDGKPSYLLGLASFAEGVDLPDDYCRHVVLAKLPFAVPDDPVDEALTEWLEEQGRNAFLEVSVPDAAMRLVQACGRLIRHEGDHGRITILDRRLVTRGYGRALLESLPPYRLELP
ncbi:MAG: ATP-dependent DNA helicase DinG, partial [Gammaproteobacteria bacterium]|nr:ATP-dependent DNA helicase DinG [Gammaproteobacteria bacterium]